MTVVRSDAFLSAADVTLEAYSADYVRVFGAGSLRVLAAADRVDPATAPERLLYIDTNAAAPNTTAPYRVTVTGVAAGTASAIVGARFRSSDGGHGYFVIFRPGSSNVTFGLLIAGAINGLGTAAHAYSDGTYTLGIEVEGTGATVTIRAYVNDVLVGSYDHTGVEVITVAGRPAIGLESDASVWLDDYEVDDLSSGGAPTGQPTMRRWGGVPHMLPIGRRGW